METLDFLIFIVVADVALIMILDIRRSVINVRKEPHFVHFDSRFQTLNDVVENIVAYKCLRGQKKSGSNFICKSSKVNFMATSLCSAKVLFWPLLKAITKEQKGRL